ncbi:class I SAM-dependent methyltransferase [Oscillatoria salina]|uniref:class I SAM-dependent methyltransferase n=1 Tax=Oscillatoria salina TaxID=331517 RepID=UPI001CD013E6|nr:class I SAM-dependent methyltransferase [Oscillatoria salina]MBZ8179723.1 class I SAM-dependent methyltransferase [Oscillatoria salina IIICB1]
MNCISVDDLVNNLAALRLDSPMAIIGTKAGKIFDILAKKWGLSSKKITQYIDKDLEAITSSEGEKTEYNLIILLPDILAQIYQIEERYQKIVALAQKLRRDGRIVILVVDPGNLGLMERRWDDSIETRESRTQLAEVNWIKGIRHCESEGTTAIITRSELLLSFATANLTIEEEPLTKVNNYPSLGLQRFIARKELHSPYSNGQLYNLLVTLPEAYKEFVLSYITPGMEVLELGSGTGRFSLPLLEKGAKVTGIEIEERLLNEAKINLSQWLKKEKLELIHGDISLFDLKRQFDFAFLSGEILSYLPEVEKRHQFFQCVSAHLREKARLLIILDNPAIYMHRGYRRTRTRQRQLSDGSILRITEDRAYDPVGMYQMGIEQYSISSEETFFQGSHSLKHGIILTDEIRLQAHLTGLKLVETYGNYQREKLLPSSDRAIYVLEKVP